MHLFKTGVVYSIHSRWEITPDIMSFFCTHTHASFSPPGVHSSALVTVAMWDLILTDLNDFWILPRLPPRPLSLSLCVYLDLSLSHTQPISIVLSLTYLSHSLMKQGNRWSVFNEIRVWPPLLNHLCKLKSKWLFTVAHADCKAAHSRQILMSLSWSDICNTKWNCHHSVITLK